MFSSNSTFSFAGIGVIETQVAKAVVFGGNAKIEADRFRVADMQVAVRLGRKSRMHTAAIFVGFDVFCDACPDEVQ